MRAELCLLRRWTGGDRMNTVAWVVFAVAVFGIVGVLWAMRWLDR